MLDRRSVLAFKTEGTAGTAESLTQSDVPALNIFNAAMTPDISADGGDDALAGGGAGSTRTIMGARKGRLSFETELFGSGSGGSPDPACFTTLLAGCGYVETSNVYAPTLLTPDAPASAAKTVTFGLYQDGLLTVLSGAMGTAKIKLASGRAARVAWEFQGIYGIPTDVAVLSPGVQTLAPLYWRAGTCTIGGAAVKVATMEIDLANEIYMREDPSTASGYYIASIVDMKPGGTLDPERVLAATTNRQSQWLAHTEQALSVALGTVTIGAPKLQFVNVQPGARGKMAVDNLTFRLNRSAAAGNDHLTITWS